MRRLTDAELKDFVLAVRAAKSINFEGVAKTMKFECSYAKQIAPRLKEPWLRELMEECIAQLRTELLDGALQVALYGKTKANAPELSYIKEVVKLIDSGAILGKMKDDKDDDQGMTEEQEAELMKQFGIGKKE